MERKENDVAPRLAYDQKRRLEDRIINSEDGSIANTVNNKRELNL